MPLPKTRDGEPIGFRVYSRISNEGTLGDPETIIWSSIRHLCTRDVAESIAASRYNITNSRDRESVARNLKLYIGQAFEFYEAARSAKPHTAPLIHYYSFLNLAKAICELRRPNFHRSPECYRHGVSWRPDPQNVAYPSTESVSLTTRGVWHVLWESITRSACPAANPTRIW
jgi:YaaC-like Protein